MIIHVILTNQVLGVCRVYGSVFYIWEVGFLYDLYSNDELFKAGRGQLPRAFSLTL